VILMTTRTGDHTLDTRPSVAYLVLHTFLVVKRLSMLYENSRKEKKTASSLRIGDNVQILRVAELGTV